MRAFLTNPDTLFQNTYSNISALSKQIRQYQNWGEDQIPIYKYYIENQTVSILNTTTSLDVYWAYYWEDQLFNWYFKGLENGKGNFMQPYFRHDNLIIQVMVDYWVYYGSSQVQAKIYTLKLSTVFYVDGEKQYWPKSYLRNISKVSNFTMKREENTLKVLYSQVPYNNASLKQKQSIYEISVNLENKEYNERFIQSEQFCKGIELSLTKEYLIINCDYSLVSIYLRPTYTLIYQDYLSKMQPVRVSPEQTYLFSIESSPTFLEIFKSKDGQLEFGNIQFNTIGDIDRFYTLSDGIAGFKRKYMNKSDYQITRLCSFREYLNTSTFQCLKCPDGQITLKPFDKNCVSRNASLLADKLINLKFKSYDKTNQQVHYSAHCYWQF
ncbi:hypothetical protein FGO68_gene15299 [Halteria grandinella]|uniref:Uncharacterized protein n=1 Tax=Halteria grandinella TaxID=5974 RepID=A0A8J8NF74_HALGN|nr:hypothetical protein FGO68_gene15299 [Halteria grandinella]